MLQEGSPALPPRLQALAALTAASCGGPLLDACRKKGLRLDLLMLYMCMYISIYICLLILFLVKEKKKFNFPSYKGEKESRENFLSKYKLQNTAIPVEIWQDCVILQGVIQVGYS